MAHTRKLVDLETAEDLVACIEAGFKAPRLDELVHPTNPNLTAVESIPIIPSTEISAMTHCLFDVDPHATHALGDIPIAKGAESKAILRAMSNPKDPSDAFVWFYLRPEDTPTGDEVLAYVRDYDLQRNDRTEQSFVLLIDKEGPKKAKYVPITTQFHLRKRRLKSTDTQRQPHALKIIRRQPSSDL